MNKHVSNGLEFQVTYMFSKFLNDVANQYTGDCSGSPGMGLADYFGPGARKFTWGLACTDVTNSLHFNVLYHFPNLASNNFAAKFEHGWWMGTIWGIQGGFPFTPLVGTNRSQSQVNKTNPDHVKVVNAADVTYCQTNSCKYVPVPFNHKNAITHNPAQWYNPNMFAMEPMTTGPGNGVICTSSTCRNDLGNTERCLAGAMRGHQRFERRSFHQ